MLYHARSSKFVYFRPRDSGVKTSRAVPPTMAISFLFQSTLDTAHCAQRRPQRRRDQKESAYRPANFESAWAFLREGQKSELDYPGCRSMVGRQGELIQPFHVVGLRYSSSHEQSVETYLWEPSRQDRLHRLVMPACGQHVVEDSGACGGFSKKASSSRKALAGLESHTDITWRSTSPEESSGSS